MNVFISRWLPLAAFGLLLVCSGALSGCGSKPSDGSVVGDGADQRGTKVKNPRFLRGQDQKGQQEGKQEGGPEKMTPRVMGLVSESPQGGDTAILPRLTGSKRVLFFSTRRFRSGKCPDPTPSAPPEEFGIGSGSLPNPSAAS